MIDTVILCVYAMVRSLSKHIHTESVYGDTALHLYTCPFSFRLLFIEEIDHILNTQTTNQ